MNKFIDTHVHYNARQFKKDEKQIIEKVSKTTKLIINCGTNIKEIDDTLRLINTYENMYGVIGFFPVDTVELENNLVDLVWLEEKLKFEKIIGLGEIGLDYHWNKPESAIQKKWFIKQIELANKLHLPICVHSRDAEKDTIDILLNNKPEYGCIIHCYSYGPETVEKLSKINAYFGIGGTSTYKQNNLLREAIKKMPFDKILLETDAPYLTPEPNRRQRNDSSKIEFVVKNLSNLLELDENETVDITNKNTLNAYPALKKYIKD